MSEDGVPKKPVVRENGAGDWREIAEKASNEKDPHKLIKLVEDLCHKLDDRDANRKRLR